MQAFGTPLISAISLLLVASIIPAGASQAAPVFVPLGTDPAGDDPEGWGNQANVDTSEADDIVAAAVSLQGANLVFKITITELPDEADLQHGQTCWMPAFQVNGGETEFVGLMCGNWIAGEFQGWVAKDTSRGTEVATSASFMTGEKAVLVTVPLEKISAAPGDRLTDIYCLTYFDQPATTAGPGVGGLFVGDAAPNAKSTAAATTSFGNWTIGSPVAGDGPATQALAFVDLPPGAKAETEMAANESTDSVTIYNWTYDGGDLAILANVSVLAGTLNITVAGEDNTTLWSDSWNANDTKTAKREAVAAGPITITLNATGFAGVAKIQLYVKPPEQDTGSAGATATVSGSNETAGPASASGGPSDTPGLPALLVLASIVAAVALRRRN